MAYNIVSHLQKHAENRRFACLLQGNFVVLATFLRPCRVFKLSGRRH